MSMKVYRFVLITFLIIAFSATVVFGGTSTTSPNNGHISDMVGDNLDPSKDVVALSWNIDKSFSTMSLYVYRLSNEGDWNYSINIISGVKRLRIDVECINDTDNMFVSVQTISLYDAMTNTLPYRSTTQWFLGVFSYVQIPFSYITDSVQSGFEFDFNVVSEDDLAPDYGYIKISTIPTYPWYLNFSLLIFPLVGVYIFKKRKFKY